MRRAAIGGRGEAKTEFGRTPPPIPSRQAKSRRNIRTPGRRPRGRRRSPIAVGTVAGSRVRRGGRPPDSVVTCAPTWTRVFPACAADLRNLRPPDSAQSAGWHAIFGAFERVAWCVRPQPISLSQWGAHMSNSIPSVASTVAAVADAHVRAGVPWRSARPVRRPSSRGAVATAAVRCGAAVADAHRDGPIHAARSADRPAYTAGLRHTSCVDWAAVAARLAARFPVGHDARSEFDGFVDATLVIDAANGASVCIPDPDYRGGLI